MPEHTIAENLARLTAARTAIAGAITAKGGTVAAGDGLEDFPTGIATIPTEPEPIPEGYVMFYDYDGTVTNSYSKEEFLRLSAMPANPMHEGLTAQGWNWSLSDAQAYVRDNGPLDIGQMYVTSDGKTRIKIEISELELVIKLIYFSYAGNSSVDINWGDGNSEHFAPHIIGIATKGHTYQQPGSYTIALSTDNTVGVNVLTSIIDKPAAIKEILIGDRITISSDFAQYSVNLKALSIPMLESLTAMPLYFLNYSSPSNVVIIPNGVTSFNTGYLSGTQLRRVILPFSFTSNISMTDKITLGRVYIPENVTALANNAFRNCASLKELVIPSGVATIGISALASCYSLRWIKFKSSTPATVGNSNAFLGIPTDCIIYVPSGSLEDYEDETNYPDPDVYTYVEYQ